MVILLLLAAFSGVISALGLYTPWLWFLSPLGLLPFMYVLDSLPASARARTFFAGWLFGLAYCGMSLLLFWTVIPLDWFGITDRWREVALVGFSWTTVVITMGFFCGLFALAFNWLKKNDFSDALLGASLWTIAQYLQMFGFALLTIAPASLFGAHFSVAMLGYSLAWNYPLLQAASWGGIYALTFVAAFLGMAAYRGIWTGRLRWGSLLSCVCVLAIFLAIDHAHSVRPTDGKTVNVALVSTNLPEGDAPPKARIAQAKEMLDASAASAKTGRAPDILVFPEAADVLRKTQIDLAAYKKKFLGTTTVALIDSGPYGPDDGLRVVRMFMYDADSKMAATYDKAFFVPQGEYTPNLAHLAMRTFGGTGFEDRVEKYRSFKHGTEMTVAELNGARIAALFCFEVLSPELYRAATNRGAQILINSSSQAFFHGSPIMDTHILAISKVRAVENGRYLLISGNVVPSSIINDKGDVLSRSHGSYTSVLVGDVPVLDRKTPYVIFGAWVLLLPLLFVLYQMWRRYRYAE